DENFSNEKGRCQGLRSSSFRAYENEPHQYYIPVCFDGTSTIFWKIHACNNVGLCKDYYNSGLPGQWYWVNDTSNTEVDEYVGNPYCETWGYKLRVFSKSGNYSY